MLVRTIIEVNFYQSHRTRTYKDFHESVNSPWLVSFGQVQGAGAAGRRLRELRDIPDRRRWAGAAASDGVGDGEGAGGHGRAARGGHSRVDGRRNRGRLQAPRNKLCFAKVLWRFQDGVFETESS